MRENNKFHLKSKNKVLQRQWNEMNYCQILLPWLWRDNRLTLSLNIALLKRFSILRKKGHLIWHPAVYDFYKPSLFLSTNKIHFLASCWLFHREKVKSVWKRLMIKSQHFIPACKLFWKLFSFCLTLSIT